MLFCVCLLCISSNCKKLSNSNFRRERWNIFYTLFCLSDRKLKKRDKNNLKNLMKQCSSIEFVLRTKKFFSKGCCIPTVFLPKKTFGRKITYIVLGISAHFETKLLSCHPAIAKLSIVFSQRQILNKAFNEFVMAIHKQIFYNFFIKPLLLDIRFSCQININLSNNTDRYRLLNVRKKNLA